MTDRTTRWMAVVVIAAPALGLAALLFNLTGFPFWRGGFSSDLLISHAPIAGFIRHSILTWHQVPLWNPLILSGMPLAADPLAGLWYLPNALAWALPGGLGFNILFWAHLGIAAWGIVSLLRSEGASRPAAVLGGVVFAATPKLVGHIGLGHLTLVEAVCWTPWVLFAIRQAIDRTPEAPGRAWRYGVAGALLGVVFLIDPRWIVPTGLLSLAYGAKCFAHSQDWRARLTAGWKAGVVAMAISVCVAAPALFPLAELLPRTTRSSMTSEAALEMSLPPERLIGTIVLQAGGWPETQTYLGATVVVLIACGAAASLRRSRFWTAVLLMGMLLALGAFTPLYGWVMRIVPGMSSLRVPARFLLLAALASAMLAGHALDRLREAASASAARRVRLVGAGVGVLGFALSLAVVVIGAGNPGGSASGLAWAGVIGGLFGLAVAVCVGIGLGKSSEATVVWSVILVLVALDLAWANLFTLEVRPAESVLSTDICGLAGEPAAFGEHRVFSPSYSMPQQTGQRCGLELADGVNPLQLAAYRDAMAVATGFSADAYSVTLPPFPNGDPRSDWGPDIDAVALGVLNVDRVISAFPLKASGLELLAQVDGTWVYADTMARPRAWVEATGDPAAWAPVTDFEWTPNRIRLHAVGPGRLVLSEMVYPGWQARLDGVRVPILTKGGILRSLNLPAGEHQVVLTYVPISMYAGLGLAIAAVLALVLLKVRR